MSDPAGPKEVTTLFLRSRVALELSLGCTLTPCTDLSRYPALQPGHNKDRQPYHLLHAEGCEHIVIGGRGTIDGNGSAFWDGLVYPDQPWIKARSARISPLIEIRNCRGVVLQDLLIRDSPGWTVHAFCCDDVRIENLTIENHLYGPNTDGLDINGCRRVLVRGCFIRGCDDNIIIKATADARSCEHVVVSDCVLESTCAAIGLGAETCRDIRYVTVTNCTVLNSIRMLQIIMWDGGVVEHIAFSNITGRALTTIGTDRAIHFDVQQHHGENPKLGTLRHVLVSNVTCETRGRILLTAHEGGTMQDIVLRDVRLVYPEVEDPQASVPASRSQQLSNFSPGARVARAAVVADNISDLVLINLAATWPVDATRIAAPHHGLWGRQLRGGLIDCPLLTASDSVTEPMILAECTARIRL